MTGCGLWLSVVALGAGAAGCDDAAATAESRACGPVDRFQAVGPMSMPRAGFLSTKLRSGKVLITGARQLVWTETPPYPDEPVSSGTEVYDPGTGTFTPGPDTFTDGPVPELAVELTDGRVLMLARGCGSCNAAAGLLDLATATFTVITGPAMQIRYAMPTPSGRVLVSDWTSVEIFDPGTGRFSPAAAAAAIPFYASMTVLPDGLVLVAGGWDPATSTRLTTAFVYDPDTGSVTPTGNLVQPRSHALAVLLRDGRVLVAGGAEDIVLGQQPSHPPPEVYDPLTGTFSGIEAVPVELGIDPYVAALQNGDALLVSNGGVAAAVYSHSTGTLRATTPARYQHLGGAVVPLDDGTALVVGGVDTFYDSRPYAELFIPACSGL